MARVRWVKSLEQVKRDAERSPEFLSSTVRSLRVVYETISVPCIPASS